MVEDLIAGTETITVATGIVNIFSAPADEIAKSYQRIESRHPGRFVLGIGVGHPEVPGMGAEKPYDALVRYLDVLDDAGVPKHRRVLAALGPKVLQLAADRTAGAHPYLTTPRAHRQAREIVGPDALLAPEQKVVLSTDSGAAPRHRPGGRREPVPASTELPPQPRTPRFPDRGARQRRQ